MFFIKKIDNIFNHLKPIWNILSNTLAKYITQIKWKYKHINQ